MKVYKSRFENDFIKSQPNPPQHHDISSPKKILTNRIYNTLRTKINSGGIKNVLEIGTFNGFGISELANDFEEVNFYVIDPFLEDGYTGYVKGSELISQRENAYNNFKRKKNITLFEMTSKEFYEHHIDLIKGKIDYVIVDGSHHYEDVIIDLQICKEVLTENGIAFLDDLQIKDVRSAYQEFLQKNSDIFNKIGSGFTRG